MRSSHENLSIVCNVRHRAMITPVSPLHTRFIHISLSYWTIYHSFEIIFKWELSTGFEFKSSVLCKTIASNNIESDIIIFQKLHTAEGSSGYNRWVWVKQQSQENAYYKWYFWFTLPATWVPKAGHGRKIYGTVTRPNLTNLISEVFGGTNIQS